MKLLFSALIAVLAMTLHPATQAQGISGDAAAGEKKNAMCIGCHGIKGYQASFPEVHKVPMIAGQNAAYIAAALTAYKTARHPDEFFNSDRAVAVFAHIYPNHLFFIAEHKFGNRFG